MGSKHNRTVCKRADITAQGPQSCFLGNYEVESEVECCFQNPLSEALRLDREPRVLFFAKVT